jgi:hypothetical protein
MCLLSFPTWIGRSSDTSNRTSTRSSALHEPPGRRMTGAPPIEGAKSACVSRQTGRGSPLSPEKNRDTGVKNARDLAGS